jgi:hypothetical protein
VALLLVALCHLRLYGTWWPMDYALTALAVAWLGGFQWAVMCWAFDKAGK